MLNSNRCNVQDWVCYFAVINDLHISAVALKQQRLTSGSYNMCIIVDGHSAHAVLIQRPRMTKFPFAVT